MSTLPAVVKKATLPAIFGKIAQEEAFSELTSGVQSGFPIISFRGKVWRVRKAGKEENYVDDDGDARPSVEIILIKSNPQPSKIFYETQFEEGSNTSPRCWSADGHKPDAGVQNPIAKNCAACPNNVWGSRMTPSGGKSRACSDARRMAVAFAHEVEEKGADATLYLLRIPPASLNPLKDYAEKVLAPRGIYPFAVVTKIGFDAQVAHPKLTFRPVQLVNDDMAAAIVALRESEEARRILAEATEFEAAGTTGPEADGVTDSEAHPAPAPAAASPSTKKKSRPAEEEDFDIPPPAKKKAAAPPPVVEEEEEEEEDIAPPPPPKPVKKKKAAAPQPADDDDDAPATSKTSAGDDLDAMLASILG